MDSQSKDDQMSGISGRIQDAANTSARNLRDLFGRGMTGRARIVAGAAGGVVLALAIGIGWGLSGGDPTDQADPSALPGGTPGVESGSGGDDLPAPGSGAEGQSAGSGSGGSGSGGSGSGGTGSGGGPPANRAPVIEDPGLSSDGLTLMIAPVVTDPDGDRVTYDVRVDGSPVDVGDVADGPVEVVFDPAEVGYAPTTSVALAVTDSRGATTRETFTHELAAVTWVRFRDVYFTVDSPATCFMDGQFQILKGEVEVGGATTLSDNLSVSVSEPLATDLEFSFYGSARFVGVAPPALKVRVMLSFAGYTSVSEAEYTQSMDRQVPVGGPAGSPCRSSFRYSVTFDTR
jgi:hypothetical protein